MILDLLTKQEKNGIQISSFKKGETIFHEGQECKYIGIVISGVISISSISFDGNIIVYNTIIEGEMFGNNLLFNESPFYKGNVVCKTNSKVAFIDKKNLLIIFQSNHYFLEEYLKKQSYFSVKLNTRLKILSFPKAIDRLNYLFFINDNKIKLRSISLLADQLGLTREATSRLISKEIKNKSISRMDDYLYKLL